MLLRRSCGDVPVRPVRRNLSRCRPRILSSLVLMVVLFSVVVDFFTVGRSTSAVLTLDTAVDEEGRKEMADRAARSPARLCSRDGKLCYHRHLD